MDVDAVTAISASGMRAQGTRIRVIAENIANSETTGLTPGDLPYRRKVITFKNVLDRELGVDTVRVHEIGLDDGDFGRRYDPNHPSADADGYVMMPNVNRMVEMADLREAQRSYEANVSVIENARRMVSRTVDLLRR